ncbi:DUF4296 domain-containing protein [Flavobacterium sp.]|uniref:DUF4296 domain-containing protein n=1 Tax=Flavobacterium sp. TaxID=239 RepID=UPI0026130E75|nr:DUF4296 domain-containing protein [Flavobacterium sp.]MDD3003420.1 DUF4296 domain-containing protein [Flavobacterium sp.]
MKKSILFLLMVILFANCESKIIQEPEKLISEDQMVAILYDLYVLNAVRNNSFSDSELQDITPAQYIYHKYKIDSLQFAQSDKYYATNVDEYEKLHERVTTKLKDNKAKIDSIIAKNPQEKTADSIAKTAQKPLKLRDSGLKKRMLRNSLVLDSIQK